MPQRALRRAKDKRIFSWRSLRIFFALFAVKGCCSLLEMEEISRVDGLVERAGSSTPQKRSLNAFAALRMTRIWGSREISTEIGISGKL
jgi:hypothetical protein